MLAVFSSPHRYVQGRRATLRLGDEIVYLEHKAPIFILSSKTTKKLMEGMWEETFKKNTLEYHIELFQGESTQREIDRTLLIAKELGAKTVVGAGGGKVLDTAKAIANGLKLPVIICPSIASSDAPCSSLSVVYKQDTTFERVAIYNKNPDLVLVDTDVISRSPARFLVAGMGDALSTMFEGIACMTSKRKNMRGGIAPEAALALAKLCYDILRADGHQALLALQNKTVTPALERIVEANTLLSGLGFESCGLAAAHALYIGMSTLSETYPFLHGEKVAFGTLVQLVMEGKKRELIEEVLSFSTEVGLPVTLRQIGVEKIDRAAAEKIAVRACQEEIMHNEPFPIYAEEVADAILTANVLGEKWILAQEESRELRNLMGSKG